MTWPGHGSVIVTWPSGPGPGSARPWGLGGGFHALLLAGACGSGEDSVSWRGSVVLAPLATGSGCWAFCHLPVGRGPQSGSSHPGLRDEMGSSLLQPRPTQTHPFSPPCHPSSVIRQPPIPSPTQDAASLWEPAPGERQWPTVHAPSRAGSLGLVAAEHRPPLPCPLRADTCRLWGW